jgi:hypothetical protein
MLFENTAAVMDDIISDSLADDVREHLAAFEPLVGSWQLRYVYRKGSRETVEGSGYANFGWGLRGTALVDIWGFDSGHVGTTIRFYDSVIDRFRSTWICPARNVVIPFLGRADGGKIVLNATLDGPFPRRLRWSFVEIGASHFSWTGEVCDDLTTWIQVQEIEGRRKLLPRGA